MKRTAGKEKLGGSDGEHCGVSDSKCVKLLKSDNLSCLSSRETEEKTDGADREKPLPSMRFRPIVHGFYSQSVAPSHSERHTWCRSNDPGAVKTVHAILHNYTHVQITKMKEECVAC